MVLLLIIPIMRIYMLEKLVTLIGVSKLQLPDLIMDFFHTLVVVLHIHLLNMMVLLSDLESEVMESSLHRIQLFKVSLTLDLRKTLLMQILSGMISKHFDLETLIGNLILDLGMEKHILV